MTPTSVLIVTPRWTRDGGVAAHVQARAAALIDHGLEVRVLAARVEPVEGAPDVHVYHRPDLFNRDASIDMRLGDALAFGPEIIHLHQFNHPSVVTIMRRTAPVVNSAHAYSACMSGVHYFRPGHTCTRAHGPGCVPNLLLRGCGHTAYPKELPTKYRRAGWALEALKVADLAIAYSSAVERHLDDNGIVRRKLVPLFTTVEPNSDSVTRAASESAVGDQPARRRVVFAGRVVRPKGVHILIRAARHVDAEFVICGDGRDLEAMRKLAHRLGVGEKFDFKGWLSSDALAVELAGASVVAIPSIWPEPFGLVGIEALATGRPVIASLTGGITDWLEPGVTGLGVRPGDSVQLSRALGDLLDDPARQHAMGLAGRQMVAARYSRQRHVEALLDAYRTARDLWRSRPSIAL
jgi:glycosyltransferase involved in cell wall biosynthesis